MLSDWRYWPFADHRPHLRLGLRPLDLATWIEPDDHWGRDLLGRSTLFNDQGSTVFAALPGSEAGQAAVLDLVLEQLAQDQRYPIEGDLVTCPELGLAWSPADFADRPLELAGRLTQEDWLLLQPDAATGDYRLTAGALAFPLHWRLGEKLGRSMAAIHDPVPGYGTVLAQPVDRLFERLKPEAPGWRLNWGLSDRPDLFLPSPSRSSHEATMIGTEREPGRWQDLWLRIERQTLRRVPATGDIVFGIHSYCLSLVEVAANPPAAAQFWAALARLDPATIAYKGIPPWLLQLPPPAS